MGRIDRIRENYSDQEIVEALSDAIDQIEEYREQFDADDPDAVSLVEPAANGTGTRGKRSPSGQALERSTTLLDARAVIGQLR